MVRLCSFLWYLLGYLSVFSTGGCMLVFFPCLRPWSSLLVGFLVETFSMVVSSSWFYYFTLLDGFSGVGWIISWNISSDIFISAWNGDSFGMFSFSVKIDFVVGSLSCSLCKFDLVTLVILHWRFNVAYFTLCGDHGYGSFFLTCATAFLPGGASGFIL